VWCTARKALAKHEVVEVPVHRDKREEAPFTATASTEAARVAHARAAVLLAGGPLPAEPARVEGDVDLEAEIRQPQSLEQGVKTTGYSGVQRGTAGYSGVQRGTAGVQRGTAGYSGERVSRVLVGEDRNAYFASSRKVDVARDKGVVVQAVAPPSA